ncbi:MAG: tetratricopeptide repeat protein [Bacteroidales bacterium]|nr:tetratricopeptide repeat protein [Bacteroidales bacterium]
MTDNLHTIFSSSGCPSGEELSLYLLGRLPEDEKYAIEAHLADCEMCSDELEGLSSLSDLQRLPEIVREIEDRMAAKQIRILHLKPRIFLAAAAVIILLIGSLFIFRFVIPSQQKPLLTEQQTTTTIPVETVVPVIIEEEMPSVETKELSAHSAEKQKKSEARTEMITNEIEIEALPESKTGEPLPTTAMEKVVPRISDASGMGALAESKEIVEDSAIRLSEVNRLSTRQKGLDIGGVGSKMVEINLLEMAMQQFDKQNFPEASMLFQEVITQDTVNYKAIYHLALCYIEMEKPKKALRILEKLMEDPDSTYFNQAIDLTKKLKANEPG